MSVKNGSAESALRAEIASLHEKVLELTTRLQAVEGISGGDEEGKPTSRRDLLKVVGALAAGAAGGLVLRPLPVAATAGSPVVLGNDAAAGHNDSNATTHLGPTAASTPSPLVQVEGQGLPTTPANPAATSHQGTVDQNISLPLLLVVAPYGVFPNNGATPPLPVFPGSAPLQSIGGIVNMMDTTTTPPTQVHVTEGVDGFAAQNSSDANARSAGVVGGSDFGVGVVGFGVTDLAAFGDGYIAQVSITDNTGKAIPGPPPAPVYDFEQARDKDGVLWVSTTTGAWRRLNSVIPVTPFRLYDSRNVGGARGPNSITTVSVAGQGSVPADAIGVFGNLTALSPSADGFATIFPHGAGLPSVNTLNYTRGVSAVSNHFMVPLGGGFVDVFVSGNGSTNLIIDVQGYLQ